MPKNVMLGCPNSLFKKKDDTLRLCIYLRKLNKVTMKNKCPLPRINDIFYQLNGNKVFSKIDLKPGFNQVGIKEHEINETTFRTWYGHYEFMVVPFGLSNAPSVWCALWMEFFGIIWISLLLYFWMTSWCFPNLSKNMNNIWGRYYRYLESINCMPS